MILKKSIVILILSIGLINAAPGTSFSNVFVESGISPAHHYQYSAPHRYASLASPHYSQIKTLPAPVPAYINPCVSPCIVAGQALTAAHPSALTYNSPYATVPVVVETAKEEPTGYQYSYMVYDEDTGDHKAQHELSDGSVVRGEYSFIQPDGYVREVHYEADDIKGFNAVVKNFLPAALGMKKHSHHGHTKKESLKESSNEETEHSHGSNHGHVEEPKHDQDHESHHDPESAQAKHSEHVPDHSEAKLEVEHAVEHEEQHEREGHHEVEQHHELQQSHVSEHGHELEHADEHSSGHDAGPNHDSEHGHETDNGPETAPDHTAHETDLNHESNPLLKPGHDEEQNHKSENNNDHQTEVHEINHDERHVPEHIDEHNPHEEHDHEQKESKEHSVEKAAETSSESVEKTSEASSESTENSGETHKTKSSEESKEEPKGHKSNKKHKKKSKNESIESSSESEDNSMETILLHPKYTEVHNLMIPEQRKVVPYHDVIRCLQAALRKSYGKHSALKEGPSPLTYIVLNKPC